MPDTDVEVVETLINGQWTLNLPAHRAAREQWGRWVDPATGDEKFGWEPERLDSMSKNIGPGDVVFDVGSEEGDISALIRQWIGYGDGGVVLFEPGERVWPNTKLIWEANNLPKPLACFHGFAANKTTIDHPDTDPYTWLDWPECADGPVIGDHGFCQLNERPDLPAITIDDFCEVTGLFPNVVTMDVEGSEFEVIKGMETVLWTHQPLVYVSIHPEFMRDQYMTQPLQLHQFMADHGYREKHLATDHEHHYVFWHPRGRELRF